MRIKHQIIILLSEFNFVYVAGFPKNFTYEAPAASFCFMLETKFVHIVIFHFLINTFLYNDFFN